MFETVEALEKLGDKEGAAKVFAHIRLTRNAIQWSLDAAFFACNRVLSSLYVGTHHGDDGLMDGLGVW